MKKLTVFKNSSNMHFVTRATSTSHITSVIFSYNLRNFFSAGKRGGWLKQAPPPFSHKKLFKNVILIIGNYTNDIRSKNFKKSNISEKKIW